MGREEAWSAIYPGGVCHAYFLGFLTSHTIIEGWIEPLLLLLLSLVPRGQKQILDKEKWDTFDYRLLCTNSLFSLLLQIFQAKHHSSFQLEREKEPSLHETSTRNVS